METEIAGVTIGSRKSAFRICALAKGNAVHWINLVPNHIAVNGKEAPVRHDDGAHELSGRHTKIGALSGVLFYGRISCGLMRSAASGKQR